MDIDRNTPTVVRDTHTPITVEDHLNLCTATHQSLIDTVVHHLKNQVVQPSYAGVTDVHAGTLPDCLQTFQNLNLLRFIGLRLFQVVLTSSSTLNLDPFHCQAFLLETLLNGWDLASHFQGIEGITDGQVQNSPLKLHRATEGSKFRKPFSEVL
jgi:hypothetical protein